MKTLVLLVALLWPSVVLAGAPVPKASAPDREVVVTICEKSGFALYAHYYETAPDDMAKFGFLDLNTYQKREPVVTVEYEGDVGVRFWARDDGPYAREAFLSKHPDVCDLIDSLYSIGGSPGK